MERLVDVAKRRVHALIARSRNDGPLFPLRVSPPIAALATSGHSAPMAVIVRALNYTQFTEPAHRREILGTPTGRRDGAAA